MLSIWWLRSNVFSLTGHDSENPVMEQEAEEECDKQLCSEKNYKYEELHSRPFITPDSEIPENLLHLSYPSRKTVFYDQHLDRL